MASQQLPGTHSPLRVKNTFIDIGDGEGDLDVVTPAAGRRKTCGDFPMARLPAAALHKGIISDDEEHDSGTPPPTLLRSQERTPMTPAVEATLPVKTQRSSIEADDGAGNPTPRGHRKYKTCPAPGDSDTDDIAVGSDHEPLTVKAQASARRVSFGAAESVVESVSAGTVSYEDDRASDAETVTPRDKVTKLQTYDRFADDYMPGDAIPAVVMCAAAACYGGTPTNEALSGAMASLEHEASENDPGMADMGPEDSLTPRGRKPNTEDLRERFFRAEAEAASRPTPRRLRAAAEATAFAAQKEQQRLNSVAAAAAACGLPGFVSPPLPPASPPHLRAEGISRRVPAGRPVSLFDACEAPSSPPPARAPVAPLSPVYMQQGGYAYAVPLGVPPCAPADVAAAPAYPWPATPPANGAGYVAAGAFMMPHMDMFGYIPCHPYAGSPAGCGVAMPQPPFMPPPAAPSRAGLPSGAAFAQAAVAQDGDASPSAANGPPMRSRGGGRRLRLWAHIYLHMQAAGFDLVPRLIGRGGCNMRRIADATGAKLRIRGKGSGHLEIDGQREAPTPLMVAVTTDKGDIEGFRKAIAMTLEELRTVEQRFHVFCRQEGLNHEGPCFSLGLLPECGREVLSGIIDDVPQAPPAEGARVR